MIIDSLSNTAYANQPLQKSFKVLNEIAALQSNWNGYGANAFSSAFIYECKEMVKRFRVQPEILPTARDSIQFEWEFNAFHHGDYLEIEFFENGLCSMFVKKTDGRWNTETMEADKIFEKLNERFHDLVRS